MLKNFFINKNISKKPKLRQKNTTIDKTLTYASEIWILTKTERKHIRIFERKCIEFQAQYMTLKKKIGAY